MSVSIIRFYAPPGNRQLAPLAGRRTDLNEYSRSCASCRLQELSPILHDPPFADLANTRISDEVNVKVNYFWLRAIV
jgi:hypothetical protein